ncbi:MAG: YihY family inner membrane protein [Rhodospirillales bacterium]|nr:YihY family inner membrane protein [Rhodospirillales bacterium]MCW8952141.1 YihY family inner membrane protein [Rhodospirillales bacterium]MCW9003256.1 YihY family inner membrane protein [Rhodospirillales bacterium]
MANPKRHILTMLRSRDFAAYVWLRFQADSCLRIAASLSYTSLLALVPLAAIAFAILSAFPAFKGVKAEIQNYVLSNFMPETGEALQSYLDGFLANTGNLTALGTIGLAVTAVMLLNTITGAMNTIFRVERRRGLVARLMLFWTLLTLGPLLLGASFTLSGYIFALTQWAGADHAFTGFGGWVTRLLPSLMLLGVLILFYMFIPNRRVRFRDALAGAVVAAVVFSVLRKGFGLYMAGGTTYQTLYGALATIPVFLVWMYLTWSVILLGAVLTAGLGDWRGLKSERALGEWIKGTPGARLDLAMLLLSRLAMAAKMGGGVSLGTLVEGLEAPDGAADTVLMEMQNAGFVEATMKEEWVLARDPSSASIYELARALDLTCDLSNYTPPGNEPWRQRLSALARQAEGAHENVLNVTLAEIMEAGGGAGGKAGG